MVENGVWDGYIVCAGLEEFRGCKEKLSVGCVVEINKNNIATHALLC